MDDVDMAEIGRRFQEGMQSIMLCTEKDVFPDGISDGEREEIEEAAARFEKMMARPRCSVCGEGPQFFKNGLCPYINDEDHRLASANVLEQK